MDPIFSNGKHWALSNNTSESSSSTDDQSPVLQSSYDILSKCICTFLSNSTRTASVARELISESLSAIATASDGELVTQLVSNRTSTTNCVNSTKLPPDESLILLQNFGLSSSGGTGDTRFVDMSKLTKLLPATESNFQLEALSEPWQYCLVIIYSLTAITSFILNAITVIVLYLGQRSELRKYLINLSLSDLLMSLFSIPFTYTEYMLGHWIFASFLCPVVRFVVTLSVFVSVATMTVIGINRYMAIMYPLKGKGCSKIRHWTVRKTHVILGVWLLGIGISLPEYLMFSAQPFCYNDQLYYECRCSWPESISNSYTVFIYLSTFIIPLSLLCYLYTCISLKLWRRQMPGNVDKNRDLTMQTKRAKVVKMLLMVVIFFAAFWLPLQTFSMIMFMYPDLRGGFNYQSMDYNIFIGTYFTFHWLSMAHSCLNSLIYCFMNDKFRADLHNLICCLRGCGGGGGGRSAPFYLAPGSANHFASSYSAPTSSTRIRSHHYSLNHKQTSPIGDDHDGSGGGGGAGGYHHLKPASNSVRIKFKLDNDDDDYDDDGDELDNQSIEMLEVSGNEHRAAPVVSSANGTSTMVNCYKLNDKIMEEDEDEAQQLSQAPTKTSLSTTTTITKTTKTIKTTKTVANCRRRKLTFKRRQVDSKDRALKCNKHNQVTKDEQLQVDQRQQQQQHCRRKDSMCPIKSAAKLTRAGNELICRIGANYKRQRCNKDDNSNNNTNTNYNGSSCSSQDDDDEDERRRCNSNSNSNNKQNKISRNNSTSSSATTIVNATMSRDRFYIMYSNNNNNNNNNANSTTSTTTDNNNNNNVSYKLAANDIETLPELTEEDELEAEAEVSKGADCAKGGESKLGQAQQKNGIKWQNDNNSIAAVSGGGGNGCGADAGGNKPMTAAAASASKQHIVIYDNQMASQQFGGGHATPTANANLPATSSVTKSQFSSELSNFSSPSSASSSSPSTSTTAHHSPSVSGPASTASASSSSPSASSSSTSSAFSLTTGTGDIANV